MKEYKRLTKHGENYWALLRNDSAQGVVKAIERLAELEDKIESGTLIEEKSCVWEEWQDGNFGSVWNCSNCKEDFYFIESSVNENMYDYCPNCGAKIVAIKELKDEEIGE